MAQLSCININFDSLGWNFALDPKDFKDPSFFFIADRFFKLAEKHGFKYSFFLIGKDLENPEVASRVKDWHSQGHEIGNHSYSHKQNLGSLPYSELEYEVMKSHEIIAKTCGEEPKGFIAPAFATSTNLIKILIKNNYLYDTSLIPSYFQWLVIIKAWWNFRNDERRSTLLQRQDKVANLLGPNKPFFTDGNSLTTKSNKGLLVIPLPVMPFLKIPCFHSMAFLLPDFLFRMAVITAMRSRYFYYLLHPADLVEPNDIPDQYMDRRSVIQRIDIPLDRKNELIEKYVHLIKSRSVELVTLRTLANAIIAERNGNKLDH